MENSEEIEKKRKKVEEESDLLTLSLSRRSVRARQNPPPEVPPIPSQSQSVTVQFNMSHTSPHQQLPFQLPSNPQGSTNLREGTLSPPVRPRRTRTQGPREENNEIIPPPFPWATNRKATVHSLNYLYQNQILTITGDVQCKRCDRKFGMEYNLKEKFDQVKNYISMKESTMRDRAPDVWTSPMLPTCKYCGQENSLKPIVAQRKKSINWLFLWLGQMLGCCTLDQLKYFCKHNKKHRTGAKDRVLYLTYLELFKQLDPNFVLNHPF
ncbi:uncharacterized protein LOC133315133 [Gastrolobium bilobum]|uniref:uncharacterized protein LOC133315133 n=1 Tax=Gastrolobium bilobum TaxID=150636 RepID=UPI002AAF64F6|nr:uncharacterized protein LOC133315133 [Gastrolobium bilobum]